MSNIIDNINKLLSVRSLSNKLLAEKFLDKKLGLKRQDRLTTAGTRLLYYADACVIIYPQSISLEILKNIKHDVEVQTLHKTNIHILTCVENSQSGVCDVFHEMELHRIPLCIIPKKLSSDEIYKLEKSVSLSSLPRILSSDISCRIAGLSVGDIVLILDSIRIVF